MQKISAETIARTLILLLALLNQVLAVTGKEMLTIAENDIYQVVSLLFTLSTTVMAWWKNNSFTEKAIKADELLKELKAHDK
ncbi:phage holin [Enterococcus sp. LJL128]|uniref:phage holin n=1 Tax=Enterococcus sp. LJL51 TaxID=3416656 RepID=UPI003CE883AA